MVVSSSLSTKESTPTRTQEHEQSTEYKDPEPDTPTRERITNDVEFECFYVKSQRQALIEYLGGEVCWSPIDFFFNNILPPINPKFNIKRIINYCIKKSMLKVDDCGSYVWSSFSEDPQDNDNHETAVFDPLKNIFKFVKDSAVKTRKKRSRCPSPITYLHVDGNKATWSEKKSDLKPDAHVYLIEPELGYPENTCNRHWYSSVFVLEFKKHIDKESQVTLFFLCNYNAETLLFLYRTSSS